MTSPTAATRPLLTAAVVLFSLVALAGTFMVATAHSAGKEPRAMQAKVLGSRVVEGLSEYRRLHDGESPEHVEDLRGLPQLSGGVLSDFSASENPTFAYHKLGKKDFSLAFEYTGPGFTRCEYVKGSNPVDWKCTRRD